MSDQHDPDFGICQQCEHPWTGHRTLAAQETVVYQCTVAECDCTARRDHDD